VAEGEGHAPGLRQVRGIFAFEDGQRRRGWSPTPITESVIEASSGADSNEKVGAPRTTNNPFGGGNCTVRGNS
jgi:hypothetical protein